MSATEYVVLVDEQDNEIGTAEKIAAHQQNLLHRAFSVFIFRGNSQQELLLQQRALSKYHSPGLWTNSCCSHPRPGEGVIAAAERRLQEELGFTTSLTDIGTFQYNAHFPNGLSEHELDHVLIGEVSGDLIIQPNLDEVHALRWVTVSDLKVELTSNPERFTPWLEKALSLIISQI
jgi:isopentenyl-diphosphate Delta-isomerase